MKAVNILNKRILYLGMPLFHYDQFLINKLTEIGGIVDSFDFCINSIYFKIINKLKLPHAELYKYNFNNQILLKKDYDYVLVRQSHQLDLELIKKLKMANTNAKFINFHWDSLKLQYNYLPVIDYFDKVYSFDYKDCQNHSKIEYLPLFYIDDYVIDNNSDFNIKEIDVLFVGDWRSRERYHLVRLTDKICKKNNLRFYYYLHSSYKTQFTKFINHGIIQKEAKSKRLSHKEILKLFAISKTVIDFPSSFQTGLTIRCFETLAAGLKLFTTNRNIINEPFMNPEFINIIDINNFTLSNEFIKNTPTSSLEGSIKNYSIGNYVNKLFQ